MIPNTADPNDDGVIDGDLWWASTGVTTKAGSSVIGKYFAENHYDYTLLYNWNYITENGTNLNGIICPDGWRLYTHKEFLALLKVSGFTGTTQSTSAGYHANINGTGKNGRWFGPGVATGGSNANSYTYTTDTHIFMPFSGFAGHVVANNALGTTGVDSSTFLWSSSPNGSSSYSSYMTNSTIVPYHSYTRTYGFAVRCVADAL